MDYFSESLFKNQPAVVHNLGEDMLRLDVRLDVHLDVHLDLDIRRTVMLKSGIAQSLGEQNILGKTCW